MPSKREILRSKMKVLITFRTELDSIWGFYIIKPIILPFNFTIQNKNWIQLFFLYLNLCRLWILTCKICKNIFYYKKLKLEGQRNVYKILNWKFWKCAVVSLENGECSRRRLTRKRRVFMDNVVRFFCLGKHRVYICFSDTFPR